MSRRGIATAFALWFLGPAIAEAQQQVTLAWDRNPEANVTYIVSYGTMPRALQPYPNTVDVGSSTTYRFTPASSVTPYYFSVQAKNSVGTSAYSQEVLLEPTGGQPAPPGSADFDDDGRIDLIFQHQTSGILLTWMMNGTARIGSRLLNPSQVSDTNWKIVGIADFNRDGHPDILWHHQTSGSLSVWYMNGTNFVSGGAFTPSSVPDVNWQIVGVSDMTGDGWPDLIWRHRTQGNFSLWVMNGTNFVRGQAFNPGQVDPAWRVAGTGDFDQDGHPDLVWQNQQTGQISIWYLNGTTYVSGKGLFPTTQVSDTNWEIVAVADLNGDGKPDLVWQHRTQGYFSVWLLSNQLILKQQAVDRTTDNDWRVVGPR